MSRQSKAAKKKIVAKQFTEIHKGGGKGPSKTKPLHGKVNTEHAVRRRQRAAALAQAAAQAEAQKNASSQPKPKAKGDKKTFTKNKPAKKAA